MASAELETVVALLRAQPVLDDQPFPEMRAGMEQAVASAVDATVTPVDAGGVPAEWVVPDGNDAGPVVLYLHGGGYCIGSLGTHRAFVAEIARHARGRGLSVDYRLAPEHPFPAAIDDAVAAYRWLVAQDVDPGRIAIAGDSAGGGLTIAALLSLRDAGDPLPAAGVCLSPWTDLALVGESMMTRAHLDPMCSQYGLKRMADAYLGGVDAATPLASPIHADFTGLPPLLVHVGTAEVLFDDAIRLVERARDAGVEVDFEAWDDMIHVFQMFGALLPEAAPAVDRIGTFLRRTLA